MDKIFEFTFGILFIAFLVLSFFLDGEDLTHCLLLMVLAQGGYLGSRS